jgi:putative ABC transport system permease protein
MNFLLTFRVALRALRRNKLRTSLTMLGIIIGVASVISMLSIANGASAAMGARISRMGSNVVWVRGGSKSRGGVKGGQGTGVRMRMEDVRAVRKLPTVMQASPMVDGSQQMVYGSANWRTSYSGVAANFFNIRGWNLEDGRSFTEDEVRGGAAVMVLGKVAANKLFGASDPLEKTVRFGNFPYRIIGVMEEMGDRDDTCWIPYTCAQRKIRGNPYIDSILSQAYSQDQVRAVQEQIVNLMKQRNNLRADDEDAFVAYNQADIAKMAEDSTQIFTMLLGGIASVSLLVGGIGIMNIMLVSVTERIREIGIRMAVGARGYDILMQFLVESVALSLLGGALGIALGIGVSQLVGKVAGWPSLVSTGSVVVSFGFSAFVGVFFGFYPALQASRLDPIQALRSD